MPKRIVLTIGLLLAIGAAGPQAAAAAPPGAAPHWTIQSVAAPTNFSTAVSEACEPPFGAEYGRACDAYVITATNVGGASTSGPVTITDILPRGMTEADVNREEISSIGEGSFCYKEPGLTVITCHVQEPVPSAASIVIEIEVRVAPGTAPSVTNFAEIQGGGAPTATTSTPSTLPNTVNSPLAPAFGAQEFAAGAYTSSGQADVQAGSHPALLSTTVNYTTLLNASSDRTPNEFLDVQDPKTQIVDLPDGLLGNPLAAARCPEDLLDNLQEYNRQHPDEQRCAEAVIGQATIEFPGVEVATRPIYNVVPEAGYPAQFAFEYEDAILYLRPRLLPSANGYVLSVSVPDIPRSTSENPTGVTLVFFGDPTEHDGAGNGQAFLTAPQDCSTGPLSMSTEINSWVRPETWASSGSEVDAGVSSPISSTPIFEASASRGVTGCGALTFDPTVQVTPETTQADTPSGYEVDLTVPQAPNLPGELATPDLKDAVITLPAGVSISPSAANGLAACPATGPEGIDLGNHDLVSDENKAQEGEEIDPDGDGLVHPAPGHCPAASQIGTVEVNTPVLEHPLTGNVYIAAPSCGGEGQSACTTASASNGELYGLYLEIAGSGIIVKLHGTVFANPVTGQLTTTFTENPQLPFSELRLKLDGGPRAPLANPQSCGSFTATSDLTPWSTPETSDATPSSAFTIGGCSGGFAPGFLAQTTTATAGAFSPFTLTFSRHDGEQDLSGLTVDMPPGLLGRIAGIPQCPEAAANLGTCGTVSPRSQVGTVTAAAGAGGDPFYQSGPVYLTGPYNGAPFGLSVVVPAKAGPYNLGNIVVRAAIHINPSTAAVTVVSNPFPQMIDGVPLRVQTVNVTVGEANDFTFNPTNCSGSSIAATISSAQGASASVSTPFAASGCANLPFKPSFTASTLGKASKAGGASLDVKITSKGGPQAGGGEANIKAVKVDLPKQLPSRLTTLQKACLAATFEANPAACPQESDVGTASAVTPLLASPLAGPAYLVSHGNEAFPDLEIVLQGEGVRLILDGNTDIKKGITSSAFKAVPDAPISSFELKLSTGKFSILGSNVGESAKYSLCGQSLPMPTEITAQNGVVVKQTTTISVAGCPKAKKATKQAKKKKVKKTKAKAKKSSNVRGDGSQS